MNFAINKTVLGLALALASTAALAAVTFDPETGTGFVGKGDVQNAFAWNNAQLQSKASGVSFTYGVSTTYGFTCTFFTGPEDREHNVTHTKTMGVSSKLTYDARTHKQIDGFFLTGYSDTFTESGTVPVLGGPCPGFNGNGATVTAVSATGSEGGLYVNYGDQKVLIWP